MSEQIGDATLYLGDCLSVMRDMSDASVDAVVTDPPWMDYKTGRYDASAWHRPVEYTSPAVYMPHLYRVLRERGAVVLWCRWDCFAVHADAARAAGFTVKNCIVWAKSNHTAGDLNGNIGYMHEFAVFAVKGRWARHGPRDVNVWREQHLFSRAKRHHPTEKPVNLMARAVRLVAPHGSTIADPFMGSGSTGLACLDEGRRFIGVERDPDYYAIARARLLAPRQTALTEAV